MNDIRPTPKMVEEAINWTGPFVRRKRRWWRRDVSSQGLMYIRVLRDFAMQVTMHEDFLSQFVRASSEEATDA